MKVLFRLGIFNTKNSIGVVASSTLWMLLEKVLRLFFGFFVGVWVARYLGPSDYGVLNYIIVLGSMFGAFAKFGLDQILVRDLVINEDNKGVVFSSALLLCFIASFISFLFFILIFPLLSIENEWAVVYIMILFFVVAVKPFELCRCWFEHLMLHKYNVWMDCFVIVAMALIRVVCVLFSADLESFAYIYMAEVVSSAVGIAYLLCRMNKELFHFVFDKQFIARMVKDCFPMFMSSLVVIIYMKIDQVMINLMLSEKHLGVYSAAVRINEVWLMLIMALSGALLPYFMKIKHLGGSVYHARLSFLFSGVSLYCYVVIAACYAFGDEIIGIVFGEDYSDAAVVLRVLSFSVIFTSLGVMKGIWVIGENQQRYNILFQGGASIVNVILNYVLIPRFGIVGAAYATVASVFVSLILLPLVINNSQRFCTFLILKSMLGLVKVK